MFEPGKEVLINHGTVKLGSRSQSGTSLVEQSVIFIRIVTNSPLWSSHVVWKCHSSCGMSTNCALSLIIHKYLLKRNHSHCCMSQSRHCKQDLSCSWGRDWDARTTIKIYLRFKRWNYLLMLPVANKVDRGNQWNLEVVLSYSLLWGRCPISVCLLHHGIIPWTIDLPNESSTVA
jgi:hypothetical protein